MTSPYKPQGYNALSPYFIVNGAQRMVELLEGIFGAQELRRYENENGTINHVELKIDDSVIMLSEASESYPANQMLVHVYVPDVFATYDKALALGCEAIEAPEQKDEDPDIRGMFQDFQGNVWAIGMQKA